MFKNIALNDSTDYMTNISISYHVAIQILS